MDISIGQPISDIHTWIYPWIYPWISISTATLQYIQSLDLVYPVLIFTFYYCEADAGVMLK